MESPFTLAVVPATVRGTFASRTEQDFMKTKPHFLGRRLALGLVLACLPLGLEAFQLPNPILTASARAFNASFTAPNVSDNNAGTEYASLTQGAVSVPFTTDPNKGTWIQFDFLGPVTFDRFVMTARNNS